MRAAVGAGRGGGGGEWAASGWRCSARFPNALIGLADVIRQVRGPEALKQLYRTILHAPDQATAEHAIREAALPR